jgi:SAM-dependent methyltransferase
MRNAETWYPTKAIRAKGGFKASDDPRVLHAGSKIAATCHIQKYHDAIKDYASGCLLDMGCGNAPYYEMYRHLVQDIVCIDWPNSRHKTDFLDHEVDLNEPLPFSSESFDTVLLTDVLEHIFRPIQLVTEIARVLRYGGNVIIGVPFFYCLHEQPYDFYRYTEFALAKMCLDSGLTIVQLDPSAGVPEILADITSKCLAEKAPSLCGAYSAMCSALLRLKPFRSLSQRTARLFPLGYVVVASKRP